MRSDRNVAVAGIAVAKSLAGWDMRSDRNPEFTILLVLHSLAGWNMRSDRNRFGRLE